MAQANWWLIPIAALIPLILGNIWYHKKVFGNAWIHPEILRYLFLALQQLG